MYFCGDDDIVIDDNICRFRHDVDWRWIVSKCRRFRIEKDVLSIRSIFICSLSLSSIIVLLPDNEDDSREDDAVEHRRGGTDDELFRPRHRMDGDIASSRAPAFR